jgi:uncharacterized membrane protein YedE/YeeE
VRKTVPILASLVAGLTFGLGLLVSGMANPAKVIGFLDVAGRWDPSLGFVMAASIATAIVPFAVATRRSRTFIGLEMQLPASRPTDMPLIVGSVMFGIGWGLAGFCPGPALVALGMGLTKALAFSVSMLAGMGLFEFAERRWSLGRPARPRLANEDA